MVRSLVLIFLLAGGTAAEGAGVQPLYARLSATRWRVGVLSDAPLDPGETQHAVLRKAAELTLRYGFDWFRPIGEPKEPVEGPLSPDPTPGAGRRLRWGERCKDGWRFAPAPADLCGDAPPAKIGFQASTQVVMGHGPTPRTGEAVDAHTLLKGR